jgi:hypothetical protein
MKHALIFVAISSIIFLAGCNNPGTITIKGKTIETKDGFYIDNYVLLTEELEKYDDKYHPGAYIDQNLEIKGKVKKVTDECENSSGEIVQCRPGTTEYIYDIVSIKKL